MKKFITTITFVLAILVVVSVGQAMAAETYQVKSGDTLWKISQQVGVPVEIIIDRNDLTNPGNIYVGQKLIIKISFRNEPTTTPENQNNYLNYTVRSGDILWKIAQKYNTTVEEIVRVNDIQPPYYIYVGQSLVIPVTNNNGNNNDNTQPQGNYFYYTVQPGDILWNIAQKYNTTVKKLVELNNIQNSYDLYVGRRLIIPATTIPEDTDNNNNDNRGNNNQGQYVPYYFYQVKAGDQIWTIADSFGVRVSELIRYNNIANVNEIKPNDIIIVPLNNSSKLSYLKNASRKLNNYYRVRGNETLAQIADNFMIPEEGLRAINHLTSSEDVYAGQRLLMPVSPALFNKHQLYRVKAGGEYIYDIAYNKGVSIQAILKANYMKNLNAYFNAGTIIVIPQDKKSQTVWVEYDENGNPKNSLFSN